MFAYYTHYDKCKFRESRRNSKNTFSWGELKLKKTIPIIKIIITPLFIKLARPEDSKGTLRSLSQVATCLPHTMKLQTAPFYAGCQAGKRWIPTFIVFGLIAST